MNIWPQRSLQRYNSLAIPARAAWLCRIRSLRAARTACDFAHRRGLPMVVLGGGSNVVLGGDINGLVVCNRLRGRRLVAEDGQSALVELGGGESWHGCVQWTLANGWHGLENLALIPGTVGGAPVQNIGAYGVELAQHFDSLRLLDLDSGAVRRMDGAECRFRYRHSIFKDELRGRALITSVRLRLRKADRPVLDYAALRQRLDGAADAAAVFKAVCALRRERLPDPRHLPNAGSFFQNPRISAARFASLRRRHPGLPGTQVDGGIKLSAGWLIEQAGYRGHSHGGLGMHSGHALVLTNPGRRTGPELLRYAERVAAAVRERFGVRLQREPELLGG